MRVLWLVLLAGCGGCGKDGPAGLGTAPPAAGDSAAQADHYAIVLVVDGVRTDEFTSEDASDLTAVPGEQMAPEVWSTLGADGTVVRSMLNTGVTITGPAHAAMLTGHHEVYGNMPLPQGVGFYRPLVPTIFDETRAQLNLSETDVIFYANTNLVEGSAESLYPGFRRGAGFQEVVVDGGGPAEDADDEAVLDALKDAIDAGPPRLAVLNLHDVDRAGHFGEEGEYPERIGTVDEEIAEFWKWLGRKHPDYQQNLMLVVTADHGRHRPGASEQWRSHSGACYGCREVPLFVVGGAAQPSTELDGVFLQEDLVPTLAAWLGIEVPWAEGLPIQDVLPDEGFARSGQVNIAKSAGWEATQVWLPTREARSEVEVNGVSISTPGALAAEDPVVLGGQSGRWACFRELEDQGDALPWVPRCHLLVGEDTWNEIGFATPEVSPFWRPALVERSERLWAAWAENPRSEGDLQEDTVGLALSSWTVVDGWSLPQLHLAFFPTDPVIESTTDGLVVAFGTNEGEPASRYTRRVDVVTYTVTDGVATEGVVTSFDLVGHLGKERRVEHPALMADGDTVRLAFLGIGETGTRIFTAESLDGGLTWTEPEAVAEGDGLILPNLPPTWNGDGVVWAEVKDEQASICRAIPGDDDVRCLETGSSRVQSFVVDEGGVTVVRDAASGQWETAELSW